MEKLTHQIIKYKSLILFTWVLLIIFSLANIFFNKNENIETELSGATNTEAFQVIEILKKDFGVRVGSYAAIVTERKTDTAGLQENLKKNFPQVAQLINMTKAESPVNFLAVIFKAEYPIPEIQDLTPVIRSELEKWSEETGVKAYLTGSTAFQYDAKASGREDSLKGEGFALIISLFVLVFSFGSFVAAFLPLVTGAVTLIFLYGIIKLFAVAVNPVSMILTSLIGLALAIDYSLFIVSRFREELKTDQKKALERTMVYSGKTIFFSALVMLCSISVLYFPDVSLIKTVVKNIVIVIIISLVNSLILLPVLLITFKAWLDKPRLLTGLIESFDKYRYWKKFAIHVVNYPKSYFILSVLLLTGLSLPAINMKLWSPVHSIAPHDSESYQGFRLLEKSGWGGELMPVNIVVTAKQSVYEHDFLAYIYDFTKSLEKHPSVSSVQSITTLNPGLSKNDYYSLYNSVFGLINRRNNPLVNQDNNITVINIYPKELMNLSQSEEIINFARNYAEKNPDYKIITGGLVARINDYTRELYSYIPQMLFIIFAGIYLLLLFYMKSVVLPLKAAFMNFLPILSSFGILVLIFQYGYFQNIFHTPFNGAITNIVPLILFCVVFGLSMDYEVLILSRISEAYEISGEVKYAVVEGLARSGSLITGAALILLGVFIPGAFSTSPQTQEICLGIVCAILIDATVVRLLLVPSFMMLLGRWNWWTPVKKIKTLKY